MRILIQRVKSASVEIDKKITAKIGSGLLVFVGICNDDGENDIEYLTSKLVNLRVFDDENGVMNLSAKDINGEILVVSQFTLYAQTKKGNRPSYILAAKPEISVPLYEKFCDETAQKLGKNIQTGTFGADMKIELINDGPVTIWIDSKENIKKHADDTD
ncbi:MAG: D-tyrosyl-tRNA(Tyr) deacylase [Prevotellaceae bacterium]|jgi:D-tyrosyl-tRNA(Tyr) deacylase|nr:D-tyrosyl-tRNA(Tyr) deacylase [Prevotellaceae bacterium]